MKLGRTLPLLVTTALLVPRLQAPDPANPHQALVPPERVRVTIGGEAVELGLGETLTRPGQPELKVELLPTRVFELPGVCRFEFPREWSCSGLLAAPEPADGWWNLGGTDLQLYLRRHGGDAAAVHEEYVANLERSFGRTREPAAVLLGGRMLQGSQVRYSSGSFHGLAAQERVQEVYPFSAGGHAYLLTLDKALSDPPVLWIDLATFPDGTPGRPITLATPAASAAMTTLTAAWRWLDG